MVTAAGRAQNRKFTGQRLLFYHCAMQSTREFNLRPLNYKSNLAPPPNRYTTRMHGTSYSVQSVCVCASAMSLESWLREISGPSNSGPPADQQRMTPVDDLPRLGSADAVSPFDDDNTSEVSRCSRFETMPARRRDVQKLQPVQPADYRYIYRLPSLEILKKNFRSIRAISAWGLVILPHF